MESTSQTSQLILPSSSSSLPRKHYDVFLSFRGEDTRKSFTDHLFAALCRAGIHTFRDAEELRKGEDISTDIFSAIQESMVSIIVFSKTYASSHWCLEEVVKIVECKEKANQVVLPVFYDVDPSEVRNQTGGFGVALALHQQLFGTEKVCQWKTTLTKVANFSGWDLRNIADGYESKFIDNIVEKVLQVVNHTYFDVAKYPIGIHARVKEVLSFLKSEVDGDVCMIGIYGMGGVGKTTVAKAVFNQIYRSFDGSCFLGDVRQKCLDGGRAALKCLQEQLLCDTLNRKTLEVHNVDRGISLIKERLGLKKVLIVVDDVEDKSQLDALVGERDWFSPGSRIIITTRNVNLLNGLRGECEKYNVEVLSSEESLQLFSWHAFKKPSPLEAFIELSNMIVRYLGGLPLALTTLGSHFGARSSIQEWIDDFEKLKRIPHGPHTNILETLKISYDPLDDDTQRIFLDIACFFTCQYFSEGDIVKILNGCGFHAQSGIRTLIDRCLLEESLRMHDLVQDMGREIVRKESPMQPEKRSRLFLYNEVPDVLTNNKGTDAIETMIIRLSDKVHLSTKVFSKMTKLRALIINSGNAKGSLKYLSNELRYLYWDGCPLSRISSDLCLENLVILEIQLSNIKEFQPKLQYFRCLQILRLKFCWQLKRAPNFVGAHSLKELSLESCSKLFKLPQSIGDLKNLICLDLRNCKNLNGLPSSICNLTSLKHLDLEGCSKMKELPQSIGDLENLVKLKMEGCKNLRALPSSIRNLMSLNHLDLKGCSKMKGLTQSIGDLENLVELKMEGCNNLIGLPNSIRNLMSLKHLDLKDCSKMKELPQSIGDLENLVELDLSNCEDLNALPSSICNLKSLEWFSLACCSKIKELPIDLGKLKWLKYLNASKTSVTHVPTSCGSLRHLNYLILGPQPSRGRYYDEECIGHSNTNLCSLATLQTPYEHVQHLDLPIGDGILTTLNLSYSDFDTLPFNLSHLSKLEYLVLNNCPNLSVIEDDLPLSLYHFSVENCPLLKSIPDLSGLLRLRVLNVGKCSNLIEVVGVENLVNLERMDIRGCSALSSKYWCDNFFKGLFKSPNIGGHFYGFVRMGVSKDMVPQYLWSNQGVGCSSANYAVSSNSWGEKLYKPLFKSPNIGGAMRRSNEVGECSSVNYTLPLFLKNKRIFIIVMVSCSLHPWSLWIPHFKQFSVTEHLDGKKELECVVYEQPNEVKEVEVLIELYSVKLKEVEDKLSIETRVVYEDEGELCFFPINPKKVFKFTSWTWNYFGKKTRVKVIVTRGLSWVCQQSEI
ncbi:disease resistance protein TAO1-like [Ipomoea triloba]|uniref:disease resistance protein TAO1-like n=1 Tax=Ipomoea triloba TaxID=35885 RepID=UPI00125D4EBC|nr:disease resistance protein TAO1-like [Ipomoea triloba]